MTVQERYTEYDLFAWFYNRHWGWFARYACTWIEVLLLPGVPAGGRVLDLCCGTGQLAGMLTGMGYGHVHEHEGRHERWFYGAGTVPGGLVNRGQSRAILVFAGLCHYLSLSPYCIDNNKSC